MGSNTIQIFSNGINYHCIQLSSDGINPITTKLFDDGSANSMSNRATLKSCTRAAERFGDTTQDQAATAPHALYMITTITCIT